MAERLDVQLDQAAIEFVNHKRAVQIADGQIEISSIYHWFQDDFGGSDQGVISHLKAYAEPDLAMKLEGLRSIQGHGYDWHLNDVSGSTAS